LFYTNILKVQEKQMRLLGRYAGFVVASLLLLSTSLAYAETAPLDADTLMRSSSLDIDRKQLLASEILVFPRADEEGTDSEIAIEMMLYLEAPYADVVKALGDQNNRLTDYPGAMAVQIDPADPEPSFNALRFTKEENGEVLKLFDYREGDAFNLSSDEISIWRKMASQTTDDPAATAASFYKKVFAERLNDYREKGILSIPSYRDSRGVVDITEDFEQGTQRLTMLQRWFPSFYSEFLNYPKVSQQGYTNRFNWIKDGLDDRPVLILEHQMVKEDENLSLIADWQYFISQGLDALQAETICLPYNEGTLIMLDAQTFTGRVTGFGSTISHKIGRYQMERHIRPLFETLKKKFIAL